MRKFDKKKYEERIEKLMKEHGMNRCTAQEYIAWKQDGGDVQMIPNSSFSLFRIFRKK